MQPENLKTMTIWLTTIGQRLDNAENTRTFLLANALASRGHKVVIWTSSFDHIRKSTRSEYIESPNGYKYSDSISIKFGKGCGYSNNVSLKRLVDHLLVANSIISQAVAMKAPDLVVASLPDHITCAAIVRYSKARKIPCIVDIRDKWPDIFVDYSPLSLKPFVKSLLFLERMRVGYALRNATEVVAMMGSLLRWANTYTSSVDIEKNQVFYIASSPCNFAEESRQEESVKIAMANKVSKVVFTFAGTFNATQNPMLVLEALDFLQRHKPEIYSQIRVNIAGSGQNAHHTSARAKDHKNVDWHGWLLPDELRELLRCSDVGLLPMSFKSLAFNNKSFSYMSSGIPIINCADGDLARLIEEEQLGINVPAGNPELFAAAMASIVTSPNLLLVMKKNMRKQFTMKFSPESNYLKYALFTESIASSREALDY